MATTTRRVGRVPVVVALAACGLVLPAGPADARTYEVTKTADTNDGTCNADCSLREAVVAANGTVRPDSIEVPPGTYTLTHADGDLDISTKMTIRAAGSGPVILDAEDHDRVLEVLEPGNATLRGLRITGGLHPDEGGGILNFGSLTLVNSVVSGNETVDFGGGGSSAKGRCGSSTVS